MQDTFWILDAFTGLLTQIDLWIVCFHRGGRLTLLDCNPVEGEILPTTATLDCLGIDEALDCILTLVVTNPTVEYRVMQGSLSSSASFSKASRCKLLELIP